MLEGVAAQVVPTLENPLQEQMRPVDPIHQTEAELADIVFRRAAEGIAITDAAGRVLSVNDAFVRLTGFSLEEVRGQSLGILKSDRHLPQFYESMWNQLQETGRWQGEIWNRRKNGEIYPEWLSISDVRDASNQRTHFVGVFTDIKELVAAQELLRKLAHHDSATGLPNQHLFADRYENAMRRALRSRRQMALLFVELDCTGQARASLLAQAALRLQGEVRDTNTLARVADSEFLLLLENIDGPREVSVVADKLLKSLQLPLQAGQDRGFVSASIGISLFPLDGHELAGQVRDARTAMDEARQQGRNTYRFFSSQMNAYAGERILLAAQLHKALENNELTLRYQPQFDADGSTLVGVEALLRWTNLALGMVGPDRFVPVAEDNGLIHPIGEWVLRESCRQFREWQLQGTAPETLSVNISANQIAATDFLDMIESVLADSGMSGDCLELELTESVLTSVPYVQQTIASLRQIGVRISIDDFGTGITSLGILNSTLVRKLKIDRGFVHGIGYDSAKEMIVRAIIGLARTFKLRVIAEGVETEDQASFLRREGCQEFQGYLYGRAVSAEDFSAFFGPRKPA